MDSELPNNRQRHEAFRIAREEYLKISNKLRLQRALKAKVPENADLFYAEGQKVWVFRDELKRFVGPMTIVSVDSSNRMVTVEESRGKTNSISFRRLSRT